MTIHKLGHIGLTVHDLEASEAFYRDLFDFKTFFKIRRNTPWLAAQVGYPDADIEFCHMRGAGGLHLELLKYHFPTSVRAGFVDDTFVPGNVHFNLWVDDIEYLTLRIRNYFADKCVGTMARFAPRNLDIEASAITDGPQKGGKGYYMRDLDGHTIEIWQPAPNNAFGHDLPEGLAKIIDGIEAARSVNNTNWCDLIRLAYRYAPEEAKSIFRRIEAGDEKIMQLAKSSAGAV